MTDTIQLAKECGAIELAIESAFEPDLTAYVVTNKELEAFRKRIENEMKEKIIQEHDFFIDEPWLAYSIRSMK